MARKKRRQQVRKIKPTFFIFCEGKTEEQYINYLKTKYRLPIIIDSKVAENRITEKYIRNYKKEKFTHEKDKTFLVYDIDAPRMLEKLEAIASTTLVSSNPCFELWYLLHHQEQTAQINCRDCNRELKRKNNNYKKGVIDMNLKSVLNSKLAKAKNRAKKLTAYSNPSTLMHKLIDELEKVK